MGGQPTKISGLEAEGSVGEVAGPGTELSRLRAFFPYPVSLWTGSCLSLGPSPHL